MLNWSFICQVSAAGSVRVGDSVLNMADGKRKRAGPDGLADEAAAEEVLGLGMLVGGALLPCDLQTRGRRGKIAMLVPSWVFPLLSGEEI